MYVLKIKLLVEKLNSQGTKDNKLAWNQEAIKEHNLFYKQLLYKYYVCVSIQYQAIIVINKEIYKVFLI